MFLWNISKIGSLIRRSFTVVDLYLPGCFKHSFWWFSTNFLQGEFYFLYVTLTTIFPQYASNFNIFCQKVQEVLKTTFSIKSRQKTLNVKIYHLENPNEKRRVIISDVILFDKNQQNFLFWKVSKLFTGILLNFKMT